MIILQNLITTNHRKSGKNKDDLKLTELDVVTMRIRFRVFFYGGGGGGGGRGNTRRGTLSGTRILPGRTHGVGKYLL